MSRHNLLNCNRLVIFAVFVIATIFAACSDDTTAPPANKSPTIQLTLTKWAIETQRLTTLTAVVSDADDDPLTVTWSVIRDGKPSGTLTEDDQGSTDMRWRAPSGEGAVGRDSVVATVSDGKGGKATDVETILVGTLREANVAGQDTLFKAFSPYIVRPGGGALAIIGGATLRIEAGVEVLIDKAEIDISVVGRLIGNGTQAEPVVIRPNARSAEPGAWKGITASPSGAAPPWIDLTYTDVLYATDAIKATGPSRVDLDGCRIMFSRDNAVNHGSTGPLVVQNCAITNNTRTGIRIEKGIGTEPPSQVVIQGGNITFNGDIATHTPNEDEAGILISLDDPNGSADIQIFCNEISNNGVPGIQLINAVYPDIHHNAIYRNERGNAQPRLNLRLANDFGGVETTLFTRENYWGAPYDDPADSVFIKETIRDVDDGAGTGITVQVIVDPWLHAWPDVNCQ
jgi:hypothetical protein